MAAEMNFGGCFFGSMRPERRREEAMAESIGGKIVAYSCGFCVSHEQNRQSAPDSRNRVGAVQGRGVEMDGVFGKTFFGSLSNT